MRARAAATGQPRRAPAVKGAPPLCTALRGVIDRWHEYQCAVGASDQRGELTVDELVARQNYEAALVELEQVTQTNQEAA